MYTALKETETRATDLLPYWKVPLLCALVPRQRKAAEAVQLIRDTTEQLIAQCKVGGLGGWLGTGPALSLPFTYTSCWHSVATCWVYGGGVGGYRVGGIPMPLPGLIT